LREKRKERKTKTKTGLSASISGCEDNEVFDGTRMVSKQFTLYSIKAVVIDVWSKPVE
jgi:hypothetical protein